MDFLCRLVPIALFHQKIEHTALISYDIFERLLEREAREEPFHNCSRHSPAHPIVFGPQRKNLRILYDAIGTLADVVGGELAEPALLDIMMPPLVAKWQQLADSDKDILPLLECLTSISQALGPAFAPYAEPVFDRCLSLICQQAVAKVRGVVVILFAWQHGLGGACVARLRLLV